jgi:hypothetical protein
MDVMDNVSRPLIALLVASVAVLAVWMVALKPSSGGSGSSGSGGSSAYQSAIAKAHQAVATSDAASAAHGGTVPKSPAMKTPAPAARTGSTAAATAAATPGAVATHGASKLATPRAPASSSHAVPATPASRLGTVEQALRTNKVLALLFYNRASADDRAVQQELASVPTRKAHVVKLAVPLTELAQYTVVTNQVPVSGSPTLVLIDRTQHATTIVGFADRFEIAQRVDDALAIK